MAPPPPDPLEDEEDEEDEEEEEEEREQTGRMYFRVYYLHTCSIKRLPWRRCLVLN